MTSHAGLRRQPHQRHRLMAMWERPFNMALGVMTLMLGLERAVFGQSSLAEISGVADPLVRLFGVYLVVASLLWMWATISTRWAVERLSMTLIAGAYFSFLSAEIGVAATTDTWGSMLPVMVPQVLLGCASAARATYLGWLSRELFAFRDVP